MSSSKTAIITGASKGIGRATAEALGALGFNVIINYRSNADAAKSTAEAVVQKGGAAHIVQADVTKPADVARLFTAAEDKFGGVDVVVSNAGMSVFAPLAAMSVEDFDTMFQLNARGAFLVLSEAARRVRDGGRIIHISSGGTKMPSPGGGGYAASKAAGEQMALSLAKELGERQVTVNVVSPGVTRTEGLVLPEPALQQLVGMTPLGRLGAPADV
ncbi:MAG: SDR family NAD(P)-dependent oxidoreductase, partial [Myxococcota bacterium]